MTLLQPWTSPPSRQRHCRPHITLQNILLLLCLLYVSTFPTTHASWILTIAPEDEECFLIRTPASWEGKEPLLVGDYELIDDHQYEANPLLVYVMRNDDTVLYQSDASRPRDSFHVPLAASTRYWMCLQNSLHHPLPSAQQQQQQGDADGDSTDHPDHLPRQVGFHYQIVLGKLRRDRATSLVDAHEQSAVWMQYAGTLDQQLGDLVRHHEYMRVRESQHRNVTEKTFTEVLVWTLAEAGCVFLVALGQVWYFRRFLEKRPSYL
jgi:hypothetical protein